MGGYFGGAYRSSCTGRGGALEYVLDGRGGVGLMSSGIKIAEQLLCLGHQLRIVGVLRQFECAPMKPRSASASLAPTSWST